MPDPAVSVVVLAFGEEALLTDCLEAILGSVGVEVEVLLVDNGCTSGAVAEASARNEPRLRILRPGANTGFAGGCNLAAHHATHPNLALINSDAIVAPDALFHLVTRALHVGVATASVRLRASPDLVNSAGNPVHYAGLSWAGGLGESAERHSVGGPVASATGCAMAMRREVWDLLGGFNQAMFAYGEDTEISLRCWLSGLTVEFVPSAVVLHRYEFHRNPRKYYLLERNRLMTLLTVYQWRTLLLFSPVLLGVEIAVAARAARDGWLRDKVEGWIWLGSHRADLAERRRLVQSTRARSDRVLATIWTGRFAPGDVPEAPGSSLLSRMSDAYWSLVKTLVR